MEPTPVAMPTAMAVVMPWYSCWLVLPPASSCARTIGAVAGGGCKANVVECCVHLCLPAVYTIIYKKQLAKLMSALRGHYTDSSDFGQVVIAAVSVCQQAWGYLSAEYSTDVTGLLC